MDTRKHTLLAASILVLLSITTKGALSSNTIEPSNGVEANCRDYRLVPSSSEQGPIDLRCNGNHVAEQQALLAAIDRLDPVAEARVAAQRGDFRLAAVVGEAARAPRSYISSRFWTVEGVECKELENVDVIIWLPMSDAFADAEQIRLQARMMELRRAYNAALVMEQTFPKGRGCKPLSTRRASHPR